MQYHRRYAMKLNCFIKCNLKLQLNNLAMCSVVSNSEEASVCDKVGVCDDFVISGRLSPYSRVQPSCRRDGIGRLGDF